MPSGPALFQGAVSAETAGEKEIGGLSATYPPGNYWLMAKSDTAGVTVSGNQCATELASPLNGQALFASPVAANSNATAPDGATLSLSFGASGVPITNLIQWR